MTTLKEIIATLQGLGERDVETKVAERVAPRLHATLESSLSAGKAPDGPAWAPRKKDGGRAYAGAVARLAVRQSGQYVRAVITGPEVYGHLGARGMPRRPMLPDAGGSIPPSVADALQQGAEDAFEELTK